MHSSSRRHGRIAVQHMIWTKALTGKACPFTADIVVNEYREASGWNGKPDDPSDTGPTSVIAMPGRLPGHRLARVAMATGVVLFSFHGQKKAKVCRRRLALVGQIVGKTSVTSKWPGQTNP